MVFFQDFVDNVKLRVYDAKKVGKQTVCCKTETRLIEIQEKIFSIIFQKLFPNTWGCVGEMNNVHFRNIIISQWVLLSSKRDPKKM